MLALMFKWGAYAEGASAGRMSPTGPSHISNIVLSIVKIGVTNPERFQPLHDTATELLDRLEREFAVERLEGRQADDELGREALRVLP